MLFLDLKKAFDSVSRPLLINKLVNRGISAELVNAVASLLTNTGHLNIKEGKSYKTTIGVPQGGVLSPLLFNLYIDDLICQLDEAAKRAPAGVAGGRSALEEDSTGEVLAYADDIALTCDEHAIEALLDVVDKWCKTNYIQVNKSKSLLMRIRVDARTPAPEETNRRGYPVGNCYKYLGVMIPDDLRFFKTTSTLKDKAAALHRAALRTLALSEQHKYLAWKTLVESQTFYHLLTIARYDQSKKQSAQDVYYTLLKAALRIKGRPNKAALLQVTVGDLKAYLEEYL